MTRDDEPNTPKDLSVFAEQFAQVARMGMEAFYPLGPGNSEPIQWTGGDLTIGCGCGRNWTGDTAPADFDAHDCPLRGVKFDVDDMFEALSDPTGSRRAHKADIANGVDDLGFVVQPVFPIRTWEHVLESEGPEGLRSGVSPHFAYTIGLAPAHAELMVRGYGNYCADIAGFMARMVLDGRISTKSGIYEFANDHEVGGSVRVTDWAGDPGDFGQAIEHHGTDDFERVLCVLADDDGLLPENGGAHVLQLVGLPEWRDEYADRLPRGEPDE